MTRTELITALFVQALVEHWRGDEVFAQETLFVALSILQTGYPYPFLDQAC